MIRENVWKIFKRIIYLLLLTPVFSFSCKKQETITSDVLAVTTFYLPDTGQTISYTATKGEDSDFDFHAPSYKDNGDGTITDNVTGLMWQKSDGGEMIYANASPYCKSLSLGGFSDWRLPTSHELFGLNCYDNVNPALNTTIFAKTTAEYWWTSDVRVDEANSVWVVNAGGGVGAHPKSETLSAGGSKRFHTRAVRVPKAVSSPLIHFKDNGDNTVTDNYTDLIWQKTPSPNTLTWEEALSYANSLSLTGKNDWRVPNVKELQSLNDEKLYKPSLNKNFFTNVLSGNYWSSTTQVNATYRAWDINIDYGIVSYNDKTIKENVICVRGGNK